MQKIFFLALLGLSLVFNEAAQSGQNILDDDSIVFYAYYNNTLFHATKNNLTRLVDLVKPYSLQVVPNRKSKRNTLSFLDSKIGQDTKYQVIGPRCIPLRSNNINSNPYHPSLLSFPGAEIRRGQGVTSRQEISHIRCPKDHRTNCQYSYSQSDSTTVTDSFSVSLSSSDSFSKSIGTSKTKGSSSSYAQSISKSLENSISKSITLTDDVSLSNSISDSLSKNHEKSSGLTKSKSQERSDTNSISHETNEGNTVSTEVSMSNSLSNEVTNSRSSGGSSSQSSSSSKESSSSHSGGANAGVGIGPFSIGGNYGYSRSSGSSQSSSSTSESNWSNSYSNTQGSTQTKSQSDSTSKSLSISNGLTNSKTSSFSDSASEENRVSDSISITRDASRALTKSKSDSKSDTNSQSSSYSIDDSYTSSEESSISGTLSNDESKSITKNEEKSRSTSYTFTISQDTKFDGIAPGSCKTAICLPFVRSVVIPYECVSDEGDHDLIPVEYMLIESDQGQKAQCVFTLIDCDKRYDNVFINDRLEYQMADQENSLEFGQNAEKGFKIESKNKKFSLELKSDGNLVLKQFDQIRWENGMGFFEKFKNVRLRINEKGHLIEEVQNLFIKSDETYRRNEWITVWSSAPLNHNVTIGVPGLQGKREGYKLILDDYGDLSLYDSLEAMIWTATKTNKHMKGYKFPEVYLVPTNFETPRDKDDHNNIENSIKLLDTDFLKSLDYDCSSVLKENDGLTSKNERFKLILKPTGNLIIKDGFRTMWQTSTKNLPYAKGPFKLVVSVTGNIMILDDNSNILWASVINNEIKYNKPVSAPFTLRLIDQGKLVLYDKHNQTIWDSWPTSQNSIGSVFFTKINYYYDKCAPPIVCDIRQYHWNKRMSKKCKDLLNLKSSEVKIFEKAYSFEIVRQEDKVYIFKLDRFNGKLVKYDLELEEVESIQLKNAFYITSSNDKIYVNVDRKVIIVYNFDLTELDKMEICTDKDLECQITGVFYDKNTDRLYVSNTKQIGFHVVGQDLSVQFNSLNSVRAKNFKPKHLMMLRNQLIISSVSTNILIVYNNTQDYKLIKNVCSNVVNSLKDLKMYQNKYILTSCSNENRINLYDLNLKKLDKYFELTIDSYPVKIETDGHRLFVLTNKNSLEIFE